MSHFIISHGGPGDFGFIDESPKGSNGTSLIEGDSDSYTLRLNTTKSLPDMLRTMGGFLLFSDRAWKSVAQLSVDSRVLVTSVTVVAKNANAYFFAIDGQNLQVLDMERAEYRWRIPDILFAEISKWVLDNEAVPEADLFRGDTGKWIVTKQLRDMWLEAGYTGAVFTPIEEAESLLGR